MHSRINQRGWVALVIMAGVLGTVLAPIASTVSSSPAAATPPSYPSVILADSPLVYYRLGESSGTTAADASGTGVTGTFRATASLGTAGAVAGDSNTAVSNPDYAAPAVTASASSLPTGTGARTVETWLRTSATVPGYGQTGFYTELMRYGDFGVNTAGPDQIYVTVNGAQQVVTDAQLPLRDGSWHLVTVTYGATTAVIYLDGVALKSGTLTGLNTPTGATLAVGSLAGDLDEVAVYGTALSPGQVAAHWTRGSASSTTCASTPTSVYAQTVLADQPLLYYQLADRGDATNGRVAFDASGSCRNGAYRTTTTSASSGIGGANGSNGAVYNPDFALPAMTASAASMPTGTGPRTLETWLRSSPNVPSYGSAGHYTSLLGYGDLSVASSSTNTLYVYLNNSAVLTATAPYAFKDDSWHLIQMTYSGTAATLYLDGVALASGAVSGVNTAAVSTLKVGTVPGDLDEVALYGSALSAGQLATHWTRGAASTAAACAATPTSPYAQTVLADGPSVYYQLSDLASGANGRVAYDASGSCRNGAYRPGATNVTSAITGANGSDGAAASPDFNAPVMVATASALPTGATARTFETWLRTSSTVPPYGSAGHYVNLISYGDMSVVSAGPNQLHLYVGASSQLYVNTPYPFRDGNWHLINATFDGTNAVLYLDGVAQVAGAVSGVNTPAVPVPLQVGVVPGDLDEVAVYPSSLSAPQVAAHWTRGSASSKACASTPTSAYAQTILADNPSVYYQLSDLGSANNGRVAFDSAGGCRNGAYRPGTTNQAGGGLLTSSDPAASSPDFNSPLMVATAASLPTGAAARTVETWFRTSSNVPSYGSAGHYVEVMSFGDFSVVTAGAYDIFLYRGGSAVLTFHTTQPFRNDNWHLIDVTYDGTTAIIYLDGAALVSGAVTYSSPSPNTPVRVGTLPGDLDDAAVYAAALSAQQVYSHWFASGRVPPPAVTAGEQNGNGSLSEKCWCDIRDHLWVDFPINLATGNFWHTFTDIAIPGRGVPAALSRTYNSSPGATVPNGPLGYGWSYIYGLSLTVGASSVAVNEENGSQVVFTGSGPGPFTAAPRVIATLVHNGDNTWTFTRLKNEVFTFDTTGRLLSAKDLNGNGVTLTYPNASTTVVTDQAGRALTLTFSAGLVQTVTDSASPARTISYSYSAGDLTAVTDVNGGVTKFAYDTNHRLVSWASPRFSAGFTGALPALTACTGSAPLNVITNHYDGSGRVDCQADANGRITTYDYTSIASSTKRTDPKGNVTVTQFLGGMPIQTTRGFGTADATTTTIVYEQNTLRVARMIDGNARATSFTYDSSGNRLTATDPLGRATSWTYNSRDQVLTETDPNQVTTTFAYDEAGHGDNGVGNLTTVSRPLLNTLGQTVATATTRYDYDPVRNGDMLSMTDAEAHTTSMAHDPTTGYITSITSPSVTDQGGTPVTNTSKTCYDTGTGFTLRSISPRGVAAGETCTTGSPQYSTRYSYDRDGAVRSVTDALGNVSSRTYDADRHLATANDANTNETSYTYDPAGQSTEVRRPDTTVVKTDYWPDGSLKTQIDGANQETNYAYDAAGRLVSETDPLGNASTYRYDPAGNRLTKQDPGGNCVTTPKQGCTSYSYNAANQLTAVTYSDGTTPNVTAVGYDALGRRTSMTDSVGTSNWTFDTLGRLTTSTTPAGGTTGYGYDLNGRVTSIAYPNGAGTVSRIYDQIGRLQSVTDWLGKTSSFAYDADSMPAQDTLGNGTSMVWSVDNADRLMGLTHKKNTTTIGSFAYGRDGNGQETQVTSTGPPADNHSYSYNSLNFLTDVDSPATTHSYDSGDNLRRLPDNTVQTFDPANELTSAAAVTRFVAKGSAADGGGTQASMTATLTAGASAGDQIVAATTVNAAQTVNPPAGWVTVGSYPHTGNKVVVFRKTAVGGETSVTLSYPGVSATNAKPKTMVAVVYGNVDTINPIDAQNSNSGMGGTTGPAVVTVGSVSPAGGNDRLVLIESGASLVPPPGTWSSSMAPVIQTTASPVNISTGIADETLTSTGPTGSRTATYSGAGASSSVAGVLLALHASPTGYTYDTRGNRTGRQPQVGAATGYGYDQANRLTSVTGTTSASYTYRGDGLRQTKTANGTTTSFAWDESSSLPLMLSEIVGTQQVNYVYGPGGRVLEQILPRPSISYVTGTTKEDKTALSTATTATWSPAAQKDDQIIVTTEVTNGAIVYYPTGYTLVRETYGGGSTPRVAVFRKTATGGETSVTVTYASGTPQPIRTIAVAVYRGVDPVAPTDGVSETGGTASLSLPGVTTSDDGDWLLGIGGGQSLSATTGTWSSTSGLSVRKASPAGSAVDASVVIADKTLGVAGATGAQALSYSNASSAVRGVLVALRRLPTPTLYYHPDQLGSTRLLTDNNGVVAASYTYDPYGKLAATTVTPGYTINNPMQYAGQYSDPETGFQYLRARYYDPTTGQFLTRDPLLSSTRDAYGYGARNPLNLTDPSGQSSAGRIGSPAWADPACLPPNQNQWAEPEKYGYGIITLKEFYEGSEAYRRASSKVMREHYEFLRQQQSDGDGFWDGVDTIDAAFDVVNDVYQCAEGAVDWGTAAVPAGTYAAAYTGQPEAAPAVVGGAAVAGCVASYLDPNPSGVGGPSLSG